MAGWPATLDRAGITDPSLRRDYTEQRRLVARFARAEYIAVRLLLPPSLVPDVLAATAFMHHTDDRIDQGPVAERVGALAAWDGQVRAALAGGPTDEPLLRALRHTITRHPQLESYVGEFLAGAGADVDWSGFATERDFQDYIDAYSLPAFMLLTCLLAPDTGTEAYVAGCRSFIEAMQRLDFLDDIAEDLSHGRLGIPQDTLARHGLTDRDLAEAGPAARTAFAALVPEQLALARTALTASYDLVERVAAPGRPLVRALLTLQELRARTVERKGAALLGGATRPPLAAALGVLAREYRAARSRRLAVRV
ncbi:phytoene/squalene synthase family protein [Streptomyces sp. NPDC059649]|uniref:phytoene/squalene synthase family protein n=1 Tax=Streptomyces sp. NPDC059649 TaxID=3346895 RepID=UPI0036AF6BE6